MGPRVRWIAQFHGRASAINAYRVLSVSAQTQFRNRVGRWSIALARQVCYRKPLWLVAVFAGSHAILVGSFCLICSMLVFVPNISSLFREASPRPAEQRVLSHLVFALAQDVSRSKDFVSIPWPLALGSVGDCPQWLSAA